MNVTLVDAISLNGKITNGADADAHTWTSDEDWQHFTHLRDSHKLIVMGSGTYETVDPQPERLRVVLTSRPEHYQGKTVPGQLEFIKATPEELVSMMQQRGFSRMLLVGGRVNASFLAAGLVNDMFVTLEPVIFGSGRNWQESDLRSVELRLLEPVQQLNKRGTLLAHYSVTKVDNQSKLD